MRTKLYMIALAAMTMILALSACSESEDLLSAFHSDPNAVRITAQVGKASANGFTRSNPLGATEADQKKFNDGDMISVQADGQDAVTYQLNNNEWQPQGGKFLKWESDEMNFTAYYPATFNGTINQPTEYNSLESLAAADFMSYSGPQTNTNNSNNLTLTMERKMARVVVEIDGFKDQYAGATIDNINSLSICGVKAYKHNDKKFYALIKPCEAQNSATFLSLDVAEGESKTTTETLAGIPALAAGKSYTYQLTVGKDKVSVSGITVKDWTTGDITGGKTEECPTPYITFTANGEQKFMMTAQNGYEISGLEYSVNNGKWENVVANEEVTFGGTHGDLRLRGTNHNGTANGSSNNSTITFKDKTVNVACTGDIRTLQDWRNYNIVETNNARFCYLFLNCSVLTSAPELPATELEDRCYYGMFYGCTSLTAAPELPATELEDRCYYGMFYGCTNLTSAPVLPATELATYCYYEMFSGCTSLTSAPELPATTLADNCYSNMFKKCTSLTSAPELPATTLAKYCYRNMFDGCTNLTSAPELPATTLANYCYYEMFNGCKNLTSAPELPATTLANYCYDSMFRLCTKLTSAPKLPATTLADDCYSSMFAECTKLTSAPKLPATTLADYCYNNMFVNCTNLTSAPVLPANTLKRNCYSNMFYGCINLTSATELPATTLADYCYFGMFYNCTKLSTVTMLAPDSEITSKSDCIYNWLYNAGTDENVNRTLKVMDEAAYNALVSKTNYLPDNWKKGTAGTTVLYENNGK